MPTQSHDPLTVLAQLSQLSQAPMQMQQQQTAQQQHAALQWMAMQQAQQQHAAEQRFRQQQLAQQGQHYNADLAYRDRALAQTGAFQDGEIANRKAALEQAGLHNQLQNTFQLAGLGQAAKAEEDRAQRDSLAQQMATTWHMAGLGQAAKAEEDRTQREALQQQLATTYHLADLGQRGQIAADQLEAQKQERMVNTFGNLTAHYMSTGGKLDDNVGLTLSKGISPELYSSVAQNAAQHSAQKHMALMEPLTMAYAAKPDSKTLARIHSELKVMEGLDPSVQKFLNLKQWRQDFGTGSGTAAPGTSQSFHEQILNNIRPSSLEESIFKKNQDLQQQKQQQMQQILNYLKLQQEAQTGNFNARQVGETPILFP